MDVGDYGKWTGDNTWSSRMWDALWNGREIYKVFDMNYPETVRAVFIVRTGALTNRIWSMAKPLVPPRTLKKLRIFGPMAQEWIEELRAELPEKPGLPAFLECDTDEAFRTAKPAGGTVPVGAASGPEPLPGEDDAPPPPIASKPEAPQASRQRLLLVLALVLAAVATLAADASAQQWLDGALSGHWP